MKTRRQYLYLIQTARYVKYGITDRPRPRLKEHAVEIDEDLAYAYLWHVEQGDYEQLEAAVGQALASYPQTSKERIDVALPTALDAVLSAAARLGCNLTLQARKIAVRRPRRHNRVLVRLSPDEADALKSSVDGLFRGLPDMARHAVLEYVRMRQQVSSKREVPS
jgi:hypothetical protein